jgi:hypothetical protein
MLRAAMATAFFCPTLMLRVGEGAGDGAGDLWTEGSEPDVIETASGQQLAYSLARIEHPGLHRVRRNAYDFRDFVDRLFVIIGQIDDLTVGR